MLQGPKGPLNETYLGYLLQDGSNGAREYVDGLRDLAAKFIAGERWAKVTDYPGFANVQDLARMVAAGQAIPGEALAKFPEKIRENFRRVAAVQSGENDSQTRFSQSGRGTNQSDEENTRPTADDKARVKRLGEIVARALNTPEPDAGGAYRAVSLPGISDLRAIAAAFGKTVIGYRLAPVLSGQKKSVQHRRGWSEQFGQTYVSSGGLAAPHVSPDLKSH